ncbi:MAG TPA: prolyl oligopeptidase family serine peptidase [Oligoflexus sp.]|uniref:prolyl oligopeptidase family serine peptidase n=1 Tax=Oligoflexus sp. TaxID=1971216 RepID=UPI002D5802F0|nr:prolyl oligopeptidase family serine peptidase [Oligoflexus sp.]HYX36624.1 prolyl oligopeptidase family serine peptidase [Oligoflexus sp.]
MQRMNCALLMGFVVCATCYGVDNDDSSISGLNEPTLIDSVVARNQQMNEGIGVDRIAWTADGSSLVVTLFSPKGRQIERIALDTGKRTILGFGSTGLPSPYGDRVAIATASEIVFVGLNGQKLGRVALPESLSSSFWADPAIAWNADGSRLAVATHSDKGSRLWSIEGTLLKPRQSISGAWVTKLDWLGEDLLVATTNATQLDGSLLRCDANSDACSLLVDPVPAEGLFSFAPSPDGTRVYFEWDRVQDVLQVAEPAVVGTNGSAPHRLLAEFPHFVGASLSAWWSADGGSISFPCQKSALQSHVCTVGLDGSLQTIALRSRFENDSMSPSPDRRRIAYQADGLLDEREIRVIDANGKHDQLVIELVGPSTFQHAEIKEVSWQGTDGLELYGFLVRPRVSAGSVPLLVDLHGGPMGGIALGVPAVTIGSTAEWQYWAALGYAVFIPDDRRSNIHGIGPYQSMVNVGDWTTLPSEDVLTGIDAVVARGGIDGKRVGVMGHSAGAMLAFQLHARHSERFRFVFAKGGVANLADEFEILGVDACSENTFELGSDPEECKRRIEANSARPFISQAKAPLFVMSGGEEEGSMVKDYLGELRKLGRTVEEITYPDEFHTINKPENQKDALQCVTAFVKDHL